MNTKNNKRRRESIEKIEKAFVNLFQEKEIKEISVSDICKMTGLNRSTFYANFLDVYDLAEKVKKRLELEFSTAFTTHDYLDGSEKFFRHIKENQIFYKTYFKLCYDIKTQVLIYDNERAQQDFGNKNIKYHIEFFRSGLNAIIKMWLDGGCKESPKEMAEILKQEYRGR